MGHLGNLYPSRQWSPWAHETACQDSLGLGWLAFSPVMTAKTGIQLEQPKSDRIQTRVLHHLLPPVRPSLVGWHQLERRKEELNGPRLCFLAPLGLQLGGGLDVDAGGFVPQAWLLRLALHGLIRIRHS